MNRRMIFNAVGMMLMVESVLPVLPAVISAIYKERECFAFLAAAVIGFVLGILPKLFYKPRTHVIYAKEGFIIVAFTWVMLSLVGAIPFMISDEIPSLAAAYL